MADKLDLNDVNKIRLNDISIPVARSEFGINPNDHYQLYFNGHQVDASNDLTRMQACFASSSSHMKHLWHVQSGKKLLLQKEIT